MAGSPAGFEVLLTEGAERDLEAIHHYIAEFDCLANADRLLDQLIEVTQNLSRFPERGSFPKELPALGIKEYRQICFKPYRVIYRIAASQIIVHVFADGRRHADPADTQTSRHVAPSPVPSPGRSRKSHRIFSIDRSPTA